MLSLSGHKPLNMEKLKSHLPLELGVLLTRYVDPFVGTGQMFAEVMGNYGIEDAVVCDTHPEVINLYSQLKYNPDEVIGILKDWENQFNHGTWKERHALYRSIVGIYGYIKGNSNTKLVTKRAATFLFLSETCKIFRSSSDNIIAPDYVPEPVEICRAEQLTKLSAYLKNTRIIHGDFKECLPYVNKQTFLFINPPPINNRVSPDSYYYHDHLQPFTVKDMKALESFSKIASYIGAEVFMNVSSNNTTDKKKRSKHNK